MAEPIAGVPLSRDEFEELFSMTVANQRSEGVRFTVPELELIRAELTVQYFGIENP